MATLEARLRTAAAANASLTALLGTSPFRWYDTRLVQGSAYPAVVVQLISDASDYALDTRLLTSWSRMQFTIWDTDSERARSVEAALTTFMDSFNGDGLGGPSKPNYRVLARQMLFSETEPPVFQRINDFRIFSNQGA